jgi:hypothetical protein
LTPTKALSPEAEQEPMGLTEAQVEEFVQDLTAAVMHPKRGELLRYEIQRIAHAAALAERATVLEEAAQDDALLEAARQKIEDVLIEFRDARISTLRGNGLVCRESDGRESHIIRMGPEAAVRIGLRAIAAAIRSREQAEARREEER